MKVYVDFDRTLFDCDKFLGDLYTLVNKYNITKEIFKECQNQCKRKGFNPYLILDLVKEKMDFDDKLYDDVKKLMSQTKRYLYHDTIPFLDNLKKLNYEVVILTKGNSVYQKEKIFNAKLDYLYSKLIVTMKHKGELKIDYQNGIFIDDNPKEILSILTKNPKIIIRVRRDNTKYSDDLLNDNILTVESLEEIIEKDLLS